MTEGANEVGLPDSSKPEAAELHGQDWRYQGWLRFARPDRVTLSVDYYSQEFYECLGCGALVSDAMRRAHEGVHRDG